jgi:hypothetical protein
MLGLVLAATLTGVGFGLLDPAIQPHCETQSVAPRAVETSEQVAVSTSEILSLLTAAGFGQALDGRASGALGGLIRAPPAKSAKR